MPQALASPCTGRCSLDDTGRRCLICLRSLREIAGWTAMTDEERQAVVAALPGRLPLGGDRDDSEHES